MDNETKAMFEKILAGQERIEQRLDKLESGQGSIKQHITANNIAIGEIITQALESNDSKVSKIAEITKDNLFEIALLKKAK